MEFHEVANIFPLLEGEEYEALVEDIRKNGLIEPIWTYENKIIDGRNRYRACLDAGVEPRFREYTGSTPKTFAISVNIHRRHLTATQRATLTLNLRDEVEGKARERQNLGVPVPEGGRASEDAAQAVGVSEKTVRQVWRVADEAPDLLPDLESGKLSAKKAEATVKKRKRKQEIKKQRQEIESGEANLPEGVFEVLVVDPPWPYGTGDQYDPHGFRGGTPYPEMSLGELTEMDLPAADDCVLWLWTTHKFMRHSFPLLDSWGFQEKAILAWAKDRFGTGRWLRSQTEYCIMAVKGKPTIDLTNQSTLLNAPMREHSRKPDEFYEMVDELCVGRKLDYFSRETRDGWEQFGNDPERFSE